MRKIAFIAIAILCVAMFSCKNENKGSEPTGPATGQIDPNKLDFVDNTACYYYTDTTNAKIELTYTGTEPIDTFGISVKDPNSQQVLNLYVSSSDPSWSKYVNSSEKKIVAYLYCQRNTHYSAEYVIKTKVNSDNVYYFKRHTASFTISWPE